MSDVEPLGQLRGSLEELSLCGPVREFGKPPIGLPRFPESFLTLTKLQALALVFHFRIKAIPAGISNLKKLRRLSLFGCDLRSLPKELGALKQLESSTFPVTRLLGPRPTTWRSRKSSRG